MALTFRPEGRPSNLEAVHAGDTANMFEQPVFERPSDSFIDDQLDFLRGFHERSRRLGREDLMVAADDLFILLQDLLREQKQLDRDRTHHRGTSQEDNTRRKRLIWDEKMAAIAGFVELLREPDIEAMISNPSVLEDDGGYLFMDASVDTPDYIGMQVDDSLLRQLDVPTPRRDEELWYEGDDVYIRFQRSEGLSPNWERQMDPKELKMVQRIALTSLTARVKRSRWTQA